MRKGKGSFKNNCNSIGTRIWFAFTCSRESGCNVQTVPVLSLSPFLTFPPPLAPAPHSDEKEEKEEQPVEVPLEVWHKERDRHADWEDAGEECDEYELPNDEQETGRVSQPGAKSKVITKGMMIAINCDAPDTPSMLLKSSRSVDGACMFVSMETNS